MFSVTSCVEVVLKIDWSISGTIASIFQVHFKYLSFKDWYYSNIIQSSSIVTLKQILGLILRNEQTIFISVSIKLSVSKYVNRLKLHFVWNKCIFNKLLLLLGYTKVLYWHQLFHEEPLPSIEPFHSTKGSSQWKKVSVDYYNIFSHKEKNGSFKNGSLKGSLGN